MLADIWRDPSRWKMPSGSIERPTGGAVESPFVTFVPSSYSCPPTPPPSLRAPFSHLLTLSSSPNLQSLLRLWLFLHLLFLWETGRVWLKKVALGSDRPRLDFRFHSLDLMQTSILTGNHLRNCTQYLPLNALGHSQLNFSLSLGKNLLELPGGEMGIILSSGT